MSFHPARFIALCLAFTILTHNGVLAASDPVLPESHFAGSWVDQQNADIKMSVRKDNGVYRVTGGDESYGYTLSCLVKNTRAICNGNGGQLEGENFLYQSSIEFTSDNTAIEKWQAFNNKQTVNGETIWKRP